MDSGDRTKSEALNISDLVLKLSAAVLKTQKDDEITQAVYKSHCSSLNLQNTRSSTNVKLDEIALLHRIGKDFSERGMGTEHVIFQDQYRKLINHSSVKSRYLPIVAFLQELSHRDSTMSSSQNFNGIHDLTPLKPNWDLPDMRDTNRNRLKSMSDVDNSNSNALAKRLDLSAPRPYTSSQTAKHVSAKASPGLTGTTLQESTEMSRFVNNARGSRLDSALGSLPMSTTDSPRSLVSDRSVPPVKAHMEFAPSAKRREDVVDNGRRATGDCASVGSQFIKQEHQYNVSVKEVIRDLLFVFQGIEGQIIRENSNGDGGYHIHSDYSLSLPVTHNIIRFAEIGWYYNQVNRFIEHRRKEMAYGLIGQSFLTALHRELTEYYRFLAMLDGQMRQESELLGTQSAATSDLPRDRKDIEFQLTFRRLQVLTYNSRQNLSSLASIVEACRVARGGKLTSILYTFLQHGGPRINTLAHRLLAQVCVPVYEHLVRWIFDGELIDSNNEFFIQSNLTINNDRLWNDKYALRKEMMPSFIDFEQAKKVLSTGKSINFLHHVCDESPSPVHGKCLSLKKNISVETLFAQDKQNSLHKMIDLTYKETSRRVLDVLFSKYMFMEHLKAMRRYMLLGQGDFVRHLMDLLEGELAKPATQVYIHSLSGILDSAIRATNAQYEDQDILKRLSVRMSEVSAGEYGWDVFTLDYSVNGPISTIFTPFTMRQYLRLFHSMWRAKRMEYVASNVWRTHMNYAKQLNTIPELSVVLHQCQMLTSEIVHLIQQIQYYIAFEVMECSWDIMEQKVRAAQDLDEIIVAHAEFLNTILMRSLLDETSKVILDQLRVVHELIIKFQAIQDSFVKDALQEVGLRQAYALKMKTNTDKNLWQTTEREERFEMDRQSDVVKKLVRKAKPELSVLTKSYTDMVQKFLLMLASSPDVSLQLLSFRLDFNEHYKSQDSRLKLSLTMKHRHKHTDLAYL